MCREIIYFCAELLNYWSMTFFGLKLFAKVYGFEVHKNKIVENGIYALLCLPISLFAAGNYIYVLYSGFTNYVLIIYIYILLLVINKSRKFSISIVASYILCIRLIDLWIVAVISEVSKISRFVEIDIIHLGFSRIVYMVLLFFISQFIYYYSKQKNAIFYYLKSNRAYRWTISIYSLLGNGCFSRIYLMKNKDNLIKYWIFYLVCAFVFIGGFIFYIMKRENDEKEKVLNMRNDMLEANYKGMQKIYMINRTLQHDQKNHLLAVSHLIQQNKNEEALNYIYTYMNLSKNLCNDIKSGNDIVDIIVNSKILEIKEKNINFIYEIDFLGKIQMEDMDMCALLANLLENSIEACEKNNIQNRKISLKIIRRNELLIIQITNSIHPCVIKKKNLFDTEKKDSQLHGWGMKSIEHVIDKYGGIKEYYINNNQIEIFIIIPI